MENITDVPFNSYMTLEEELIDSSENYENLPVVEANSPPTIEKQKKESLLTTTISNFTEEIFQQASSVTRIIINNEISLLEKNHLHRESKLLIFKINALFIAARFPAFQISEKNSVNRKKKKKDVKMTKELIHVICTNIIKLCYDTSHPEQHLVLKVAWSKKELASLKDQSKILISNINAFLLSTSLPSIKLSGKFTNKFKEKFFRDTLCCVFQDGYLQKQWDKVKTSVEEYFKTNVLLKFNQSEFNNLQIEILDEEPLAPLLAHRFLLQNRRKRARNERKIKELQRDLDRNKIHILGAYQARLLKLTKALFRVEGHSHIITLKKIFREFIPNIDDHLISTFLSAIADSLIPHYIEGYLELHTITEIEALLMKWKQEGNDNPLDYATLEKSHWTRLLTSTTINMEEMERALLSGCIQITNSDREILLHPPERTKPEEEQAERMKKINEYLPLTEKLISEHIGDPTGTLLSKFREKGYQLLLQLKPELSQNIKEESILKMDEQIFKVFAPVMQKMENKQPLNENEKTLFDNVEEALRESNPEVINKHGLKKIARFLFWFHRILNQSFLIGNLSVLKAVLHYIYPHDRKGITSLDEMKDSASISVELGKNEDITLEWQITNKLYSENWLFTQKLRIELPSIHSSIHSNELNRNITQEFIFKSAKNGRIFERDLEETNEVLERILTIRRILLAMKFPVNSFIKKLI